MCVVSCCGLGFSTTSLHLFLSILRLFLRAFFLHVSNFFYIVSLVSLASNVSLSPLSLFSSFFLGSLVFVPSECPTDLHLIQFYIPSLFEPCFNRFSRLTVPVLVLVPLMFIIVELCCALLFCCALFFFSLHSPITKKCLFPSKEKHPFYQSKINHLDGILALSLHPPSINCFFKLKRLYWFPRHKVHKGTTT